MTPNVQGQPPRQSLREGLADYLAANGLPADGGDTEPWAVVRLGPVPVAYPNIPARRRAVRYHDLNHVVTGYATDLRGESEIAAWELGSGCGRFWVAWVINLGAIVAGLQWPLGTLRAFARGRQTRNLFGTPYEEILRQPVLAVRADLGLDTPTRVRASDVVLFVSLLLPGAVAGALVLGCAMASSPWWLKAGVHRQRRQPAQAQERPTNAP